MIPVSSTNIDEDDVKAVADCVRSGWVSRYAPVVAEFERKFAAYCGCKYGVSTCSCSTALDLTLQSLGIGKGDEVIIPTFTMIATANAVVHVGAKPVLVDCEPDTWCIHPKLIREKITDQTAAFIPVHIYGHLCDIQAINKIDPYYIVEDAAEVHGATSKDKKAGQFGNAACYSFFANKNMTTGEGGIIVTNDKALAEKAQWLKANAFGKGLSHFVHEAIGSTVCMSGMQAALGISQLKKLGSFVDNKRANAQQYNILLSDLAHDDKITLPVEREGYKNVYWMYSLIINDSFGLSRNELIESLAKDGIETRPFFTPIHQQPPYKKYAKDQTFSVADDISRRGLNLPSGSNLKIGEIEYICKMIHKHARQN
jgi:perosamine synthetase